MGRRHLPPLSHKRPERRERGWRIWWFFRRIWRASPAGLTLALFGGDLLISGLTQIPPPGLKIGHYSLISASTYQRGAGAAKRLHSPYLPGLLPRTGAAMFAHVQTGAVQGFCERHLSRDRRRASSRQSAEALVALWPLSHWPCGGGAADRRRHRGVARPPAHRAPRAIDPVRGRAVARPRG